ncbi:MAG: hypothetical protein ACYTGW_07460 [Planctomycetota bacterium]|jgi:hypothetical protein
MKYLMIFLLCLVSAAAVGFQGDNQDQKQGQKQGQKQDPESRRQQPIPPKGATSRPLPPVQEPLRTKVERRDLLQKFKGPSPLAGFYRLVGVHGRSGPAKIKYRGYMAVGRDHLSLHLQGYGRRRREPVIQSGFRRYRLGGGKIYMSNLVGHHVRDGKVLVEQVNRQEVRRYQVMGTTLRIYQSSKEYLEFVRME